MVSHLHGMSCISVFLPTHFKGTSIPGSSINHPAAFILSQAAGRMSQSDLYDMSYRSAILVSLSG